MNVLKPIRIGPVEVASPVILAPMTAVTDLPFRRIVKRYGAGGLVEFDKYANVKRTLEAFVARPAVQAGLDIPRRD